RQATEMFQFAHLPPACLWVQQAVSRHHSGGIAPFGLSGLMACMQLPRNVSPVSASFIGLQRQGIHPVLCRACALDSRSLLTRPKPGEVDWRHDVFVRYPLLRFCWRLLGKIEVILFGCSGTSSGILTPEEWKPVQLTTSRVRPRLPPRSPRQIDLG